ncbi:MAG: DNA photolyase family protein [Flavobacterium sp.]|nr:DNA photolyase family protein [Flavobacterium sp.]
MNVFWFRRDLRVDDNKGFFEALNSNSEVLPLFVFDKNILDELPKDDARVSFIHERLDTIDKELQKFGKNLAVFYGDPITIIEQVITENQIQAVYTNHDYEPYAKNRDQEITSILASRNIAFYSFKDQVIFEKSEVVKDDLTPYVVYTPYSRKWKDLFQKTNLEHFESEKLLNNIANHNYPFLSLKDIGFEQSKIKVANYNNSEKLISNYEDTRNFPALEGTSMIGTHLRFGSVSIRKIVANAASNKRETYLKELIWREFFMQILWHFPHTNKNSFRPKYDAIKWNNNEEEFQKWCEGKTGYPFVDAGMRELNATGHMHNRVRMIVASFLCKHLLIDWRWGETYFASKLLDYEQSSNVGNWQWAAGSGVDAAPYFRIFNPTEQVKKFDKELDYIKKWIPELQDFSYPQPIVDHVFARERCLRVFKEAVG